MQGLVDDGAGESFGWVDGDEQGWYLAATDRPGNLSHAQAHQPRVSELLRLPARFRPMAPLTNTLSNTVGKRQLGWPWFCRGAPRENSQLAPLTLRVVLAYVDG